LPAHTIGCAFSGVPLYPELTVPLGCTFHLAQADDRESAFSTDFLLRDLTRSSTSGNRKPSRLHVSSQHIRPTMAAAATHAPAQSVFPKSHVGFDSITTQIEKKLLKRGFQFNVICVGKLAGHYHQQATAVFINWHSQIVEALANRDASLQDRPASASPRSSTPSSPRILSTARVV
jgi:septin 3/9/12